MNRAQRRREKKQLPRLQKKLSPAQQMNALLKNGITPKHLEEQYARGRDDGIETTFKTVYAAACLVLHELEGYGAKRCKRFLQRLDDTVINAFTSAETIDEVWQKIGLELEFRESFDRIQEVENHE